MRNLVNLTISAGIEFLEVSKVWIIATCPSEFGRSRERGCGLTGDHCTGLRLQTKSSHQGWDSEVVVWLWGL